MTILIRGNNLGIFRQNYPIFCHLSITAYKGKILHLIGENGSGKTTLLQILAGTLSPTYGTVDRHTPVLYSGHKLGLRALLSVHENLYYAGRLYHNMDKQSILQALPDALHATNLTHLAHYQVRYLSAGQQKRTQLARLWFSAPPLWLLDEPLVALDQGTIDCLLAHCLAHIKKGGGIIITSHQKIPLSPAYIQTQHISELCSTI